MRILTLVRTTALALAATAVVGGTQLSPAFASEGHTAHFRITYAIPKDQGQDVVAKNAYDATANDAAAKGQSAAPVVKHRLSATEQQQEREGWPTIE